MNRNMLFAELLVASVMLANAAGFAEAQAKTQTSQTETKAPQTKTEAPAKTEPAKGTTEAAQSKTEGTQQQTTEAQTKPEEAQSQTETTQTQTGPDGKLISVPGGKALGMSILGNQEAPTSLVIVPWKSSELGNSLGVSPLLDDSRQPVDKEVFMRALSYYEIRSKTK